MSSPRRRYFRARSAGFVALLAALVWLAILSCSSDPTSTLGHDSDLLGTGPGTVYQDTIGIFGDTTYAMHTPIATATDLQAGNDSLYQHIMVLQPGFAKLSTNPGDTLRTVQTANLHLSTGKLTEVFPVRFYELGYSYTEGDTIVGLDTLTTDAAIPDPAHGGTIERNLDVTDQAYPIPTALAQTWIRDHTTRRAIAIVYTDAANYRVASIPSSEATDHPYLQVFFTDGNQRAYDIRDDATAYLPNFTPSHLVVSDGYPRRVYLRIHLDRLAKDSAVHTARIRFHIVPGTLRGKETTLILYIPDSTNPYSPKFKTGQRIIEKTLVDTDQTVEFPMTNAIFLVLQKKLKNNGFAIRFKDENTELRQVELYGSSAPDSLRPQVFVTSSTPAVFP